MTVGRSGHALGGVDVSLCDKRVEGYGQEHHAQQKCAAGTALSSLFTRQQSDIQKKCGCRGGYITL